MDTEEQVEQPKGETSGDASDKPKSDVKPGTAGASSDGTNGADLTARLTALETENTRLKETTEKEVRDSEGAKAYVQNLIAQVQEAANRGPAPPDMSDPNVKESIREKLNEDPVGFMNAHFQERIRPLATFALDNQAALNRQLAAERLKGEGWDEYEGEVDEFMGAMPPEVRAKPGSYEAAFRFVLSKPENFEKVIQRRMAAKLQTEQNAFVERPSGGVNRAPAKPALTDLEKSIAKGLQITEEEYMQFRET